MGKYVNNGVVTLVGNVDYDDAVREIATLVGVGKREDGKYYLADVVTAAGINMMAKYKPHNASRTSGAFSGRLHCNNARCKRFSCGSVGTKTRFMVSGSIPV